LKKRISEKSEKSRKKAFDTTRPPAYIPRPRRPPGQALRVVLLLWQDELSCSKSSSLTL
jgi:hypothetical protein